MEEPEERKGEEAKEDAEGSEAFKDTPLIFCIDTSSSMNRMTDRKDNSGNNLTRYQCIPQGVPKDVLLEYIAQGISDQIELMKETKRKVGIVTFGSRVTVIGDGTQKCSNISKDLLK